jgi:hypothetical protein
MALSGEGSFSDIELCEAEIDRLHTGVHCIRFMVVFCRCSFGCGFRISFNQTTITSEVNGWFHR